MKKAVVLLSGGLDSAVTLFIAKHRGYACHPLIFDYGQRHERETAYARKVSRAAKTAAPAVMRISMPWLGSALLDKRIKLPSRRTRSIPVTYVPGRNTVFLAFAVSYAEAIGARAIYIGAHSEDYSGYPDCRKEYFDAFKKAMDLGTKRGSRIRIETPLISMRKAGIIKLGTKLGVPFGLTWSCYAGRAKPCGVCDSCYYRKKGFREAGLKDPAE